MSDSEIRNDATLVNAVTQMGTSGDRSEYTQIGLAKIIPKEELERLYKIPICRRVVHARPDSASVKGWHLTLSDEDNDLISRFTDEHDRLKIASVFREAQVLANIYGGAVGVIIADDGRSPDQPINPDKLKRIKKIEVLDRWKIEPDLTWNSDVRDPDFYHLLLPEYLRKEFSKLYKNEKINYRIHKSRIIRFDGVLYTPDMMEHNQGWGGSVLEDLWEDYEAWKTSLKSLGAMMQDASLFVYKLKNLAQMVKANDQELLAARFKILRLMSSTFGGAAIDSEGEDINFVNRSFAGVDTVSDKMRDAFIGATGIPHDILFGESPSGLGATGESEAKNWSRDIAAFQMTEWKPKLRPLFELIFRCLDGPTKGEVPKGWGIEFPSILQISEDEQASLRSTQANTDNIYMSTGVVLPEEVRQSRFGAAKYTIETTLNKSLFEKKQKEAEQQQGFGFDQFAEQPAEEVPEEEPREDSIALSKLEKKNGKVFYRGRWWVPDKPTTSDRQGKKRMVLAKKGSEVEIVHYGASDYDHNYSLEAKENFLKRSAGIKDGDGKLTKDDPFSPNYWSRKDLWPSSKPADGSTKYSTKSRRDSSPIVKRVVQWNDLSIGVTHEVGDRRFIYAPPMKTAYGHLRGTYGKASDGKAIDVYLGNFLESEQVFKVRQIDPQTGLHDEDKLFIGFPDPLSVRDAFIIHAGSTRFGGIEILQPSELSSYRQDNCGCSEPRLSNGVRVFSQADKLQSPTQSEVLRIVKATFPEEVLSLGEWREDEGAIAGEFYATPGVYKFSIKKNYCGYGWNRELNETNDEIRIDAKNVPSGYHWVESKKVNGGGYIRKNPSKGIQVVRTPESIKNQETPPTESVNADSVIAIAVNKEEEPSEATESDEPVKKNDNAETDVVDQIIESGQKQIQSGLTSWINAISSALGKFSSLEDARDRLHEIYPKLTSPKFMNSLEQMRILAHLQGMDEENEVREDAIPSWLKLPFLEQISYFRRKVNIPTKRWDEFTAEQHDFAFTIAGLTRADLLEDARYLVDQAIAEGEDIETFSQKFKRLIGRKGWKVGEQRIYAILDTNVRRSYAAGRYEQVMKPSMRKSRPYLVWVHRDSTVPRPNHLALNNKAIASDHPFWKVAFPSCAHGCRCSAFSANERTLNQLGAEILTNPPDPKTIAEVGFQRSPGSNPKEEKQTVVNTTLARLSPEIKLQTEKYLAQGE